MKIPSGWKETKKSFNWKMKKGSCSVRFRFLDENRGERFFDSEFDVDFSSQVGKLIITYLVDHQGFTGKAASETGIAKALTSGTLVTIYPSNWNRKGKRPLPPVTILVENSKADQESVIIKYVQVEKEDTNASFNAIVSALVDKSEFTYARKLSKILTGTTDDIERERKNVDHEIRNATVNLYSIAKRIKPSYPDIFKTITGELDRISDAMKVFDRLIDRVVSTQ